MQQFERIDLLNHLKKLNIEPNDQKTYKLSDLRVALGRIANKNVKLLSRRDISGRWVLTELRFCYNKQLAPIDCDYEHFQRTIYFPATY